MNFAEGAARGFSRSGDLCRQVKLCTINAAQFKHFSKNTTVKVFTFYFLLFTF